MKKWIAWLLIAVTCASLIACRPSPTDADPETTAGIDLEQDTVRTDSETIVLYYPSATDPERLYAEMRSISGSATSSIVNAAMEELLKGPQSTDLYSIIPSEVRLVMTEQSSNLVTVHLTSELLSLSDRELLLAKISIINTLTSISGVEYVSIMCDEKEVTVMGYASGAEGMYIGTLDEKMEQYRMALESGANSKKITLYFQNRTGEYLIPEIRTIDTTDEIARAVISELIEGPADTTRSIAVMRQQMHLLEEPVLTTTPDGSTLLIVNLSGDESFLSDSSSRRMMQFGAIVLSLTSNMPEVDYVSVQLDSLPVNRYVAGRSGYLRASMFRNLVGNTMKLYFPNETYSMLVEVERMVDQGSVGVVKNTLAELFAGPKESENQEAVALPIEISDSDLLSLQIQNGEITLNLRREVVEELFSLDHDAQYICVYSIVNSLCSLQGVSRVRFLADGETIVSGGIISLENALMPNIGLMK